MKSALLVISAILIIFLLPAAVLSINDFRAVDYTEPHNITTGVGEEEADITLSEDLFGARTTNVTLVSNNALDAPVPSAYVSATRTLTITGLAANDTRTMTVTYKISALDDYWGTDIAVRSWPMFLIIGVFGLIAAGVYNAHKGD